MANVKILPGMIEFGDYPEVGELTCPHCSPKRVPVKFGLSLGKGSFLHGKVFRKRGLVLEVGSVMLRCLSCGREFALVDALRDFPEAVKPYKDMAG